MTFYGYMTLEQGALSGKYDKAHPFPAGSARAKVFDPILPKIEAVTAELKTIGEAHGIRKRKTYHRPIYMERSND